MNKDQKSIENSNEVIMLPLSEVASVKWTPQRGENLQKLRGQIPQLELARRVQRNGYKVSRQYLDRLESDPDIKGVSPEMLQAISKSLGVEFSDLLCLPSQKILQLGVDNCN